MSLSYFDTVSQTWMAVVCFRLEN